MKRPSLYSPRPTTRLRANSQTQQFYINRFDRIMSIHDRESSKTTNNLVGSWNDINDKDDPIERRPRYKQYSVIRVDLPSYVNYDQNLALLKKLKTQADLNMDVLLQDAHRLYSRLEDERIKGYICELVALANSIKKSNVLVLREYLCKYAYKKIDEIQNKLNPPKDEQKILGFLDNSDSSKGISSPKNSENKEPNKNKGLTSLLNKFSYVVASLGHFVHYYDLSRAHRMHDKNLQHSPKASFSPHSSLQRKSVSFRVFSPIRSRVYSPDRTRQSGISQNLKSSIISIADRNSFLERKEALEDYLDDEKTEAVFYHVRRYFKWKLEKWRDEDLEEVKIVCRICSQEVYAKTIKKHSYHCKLVAEQEENIDQYNAKLVEIIAGLKKEKRNINMEVVMERKLLMNLRQQSTKNLLSETHEEQNPQISLSVEPPEIVEKVSTPKNVVVKKPRGKAVPLKIISVIFQPKQVAPTKALVSNSPREYERSLTRNIASSKSMRNLRFKPTPSKSPEKKVLITGADSTPKARISTIHASIFSPRGGSANQSRESTKSPKPDPNMATSAHGKSRFSIVARDVTSSSSKRESPKFSEYFSVTGSLVNSRTETPVKDGRYINRGVTSSSSIKRQSPKIFDYFPDPEHYMHVNSTGGTPVASTKNFIIRKSSFKLQNDMKQKPSDYHNDSISMSPPPLSKYASADKPALRSDSKELSVERAHRRTAVRNRGEIQRVQTLNALREQLQKLKELNNLIKSYETLINYASLIQNFDEFTRETRLAFEGAKKEVSELLSQSTNEASVQKHASKLWQVLIAKFETIREIQTSKSEIKSIEHSNEIKLLSQTENRQLTIDLNGNMSFSLDHDTSLSATSIIKMPSNARKSLFAKNVSSERKKVRKIRSKSETKEIKAWQHDKFMQNFRRAMRKLKKLVINLALTAKQIKQKGVFYRSYIRTLILKETQTPMTLKSPLKKATAARQKVLTRKPTQTIRLSIEPEDSDSSSDSSSSRSKKSESSSSSESESSSKSSGSSSDSDDDFVDEKALNENAAKRDTAYFSDDPDNIEKYAKSSSRQMSSIIKIEDFVFVKLVSKGAYGRVWLVKRKVTGDYYAMKIVNFCDRMNRNNIDSLKKEKEVFEIIQGDFIAKAIFTFVHENYLCVVMEFLVGGDFSNILEKYGILEEPVAKFYIAEVIIALSSLHKLGIVHRDLKPSNIMLDKQGHIKLTDFGLSEIGMKNQSKLKKEQSLNGFWEKSMKFGPQQAQPQRKLSIAISSATRARLGKLLKSTAVKPESHKVEGTKAAEKVRIVGTPDYIPPEVIKGECYNNPCIDWWSVGVLLFEFLVGVPPFNDENRDTVFDNIIHRRIPWSDISIGYEEGCVTPEAKDFIDKLLELDRKKRLGSKGVEEIKNHPFFKGVKWEDILKSQAPIIPDGGDIIDTHNFQTGEPRFQAKEMLTPFPDQDDTENFQSSNIDIKAENFQFTRLDILLEENQKVLSETKNMNHRKSFNQGIKGRKWSVFEA